MAAKDKALLAAAGEHLVLSRLLARGFLAAAAPPHTRKVDILVNYIDGGAPRLVQVKASSRGRTGWPMNEKHELLTDDHDLFFCFVDFEHPDPRVWVVPAPTVADVIKSGHQRWLDTPGRNGQPHNPTKMRQMLDPKLGSEDGWMHQYLEAWEQLEPR
jgi:hypothetical protein